ncbi:MAG: hypothetical protein KAQ98_04535 [Bacteriovoracaceae bacterium]|nr:hypothetical protein [Bacteriovoracaceae bacterium]
MKAPNNDNLVQIFNANLDNLFSLSTTLMERTRESMYVEVLINYLQKDINKLRLVVDKISSEASLQDYEIISSISNLRYKIASKSYCANDIEKTLAIVDGFPVWKGDVYMVCAYAYARLDKHVKSKILFKKAFNALNGIGAKRRALLALQNYIVAESNIYDGKKLIGEYKHLIRKAIQFGYPTIAAGGYLNLSRQFQKHGAIRTALKNIEKAEYLIDEDSGILQYYLILSHKCHLLIQLNRKDEARILIDELTHNNHKEIIENVKFLESLICDDGNKLEKLNLNSMVDSWKERVTSKKEIKLGKLEEKLIEFISESPRTKIEIISHLYGQNLDYVVLDNRFKNLIGRFRKKVPDLIVFEDEKYRISDTMFLKELGSEV